MDYLVDLYVRAFAHILICEDKKVSPDARCHVVISRTRHHVLPLSNGRTSSPPLHQKLIIKSIVGSFLTPLSRRNPRRTFPGLCTSWR